MRSLKKFISPEPINHYTIMQLTVTTLYTSIIVTYPYNLILVGGPVANPIVNQLVDEGFSKINWAASPGHLEYIRTPYGACSILIVAGADRDRTRKAVDLLLMGIRSRSY